MLDALKEEGIVNKCGGRFKLSTLIQKRMVALNTGAKPLVDARNAPDKMAIVIQEILQDKIWLDTSGAVMTGDRGADDAARQAMQGEGSADLGDWQRAKRGVCHARRAGRAAAGPARGGDGRAAGASGAGRRAVPPRVAAGAGQPGPGGELRPAGGRRRAVRLQHAHAVAD